MTPAERLLQSSWCNGWAGGQDLRWELPWGQKKLACIGLFNDSPIISRSCFKQVLLPTNFPKTPIHFQQISKVFPKRKKKSQVL